jgi:lipoate-protein ligase B
VLSELEKRKQEGTCIIIIHHGELYTKGTEETAHKIILDKNGLTDVKEIDV